MRRLSTREVALMLGLPESRVREWARRLLGRPAKRGRAHRFDFQDLVVLRTAAKLLTDGVPAAGITNALSKLRAGLHEGQSLSQLRISAGAQAVIVEDESGHWNAETGQRLLRFDEDPEGQIPVAELGKALAALDLENTRDQAEQHFEDGLDLEEADPLAAIDAYQKALQANPEMIEASVNLARLLHLQGEPLKAASMVRVALKKEPGEPLLHFNLAICLQELDGPRAALTHFLRAAELDPSMAEAHWGAGELLEKLGRRADALRHYREYARLTEGPGAI